MSTNHNTNRSAGQDLQKEACRLYSAITGVPWGSSQNDNAEIKPRTSGRVGTDVVLSSRARELLAKINFPTCCECKNTKQWDLQRAILQVRANALEGNNWIIILKRRAPFKVERINPVVVMDLKAFQDLILTCLKT